MSDVPEPRSTARTLLLNPSQPPRNRLGDRLGNLFTRGARLSNA
jgi:hypothetical protein